MTVRTLLQVTLINMTTIVTNSIGDIEGEIITTFLGSHFQQMQILLLRKMLIEIHVKGRATSQMLDIRCPMQLKLIDDGK